VASLRPSEYKLLNQNASSALGASFLELEEADEGGVDVFFCADSSGTATDLTSGTFRRERILNVQPEFLTIWPINVRPDKDDYLLPKYGALELIRISQPVRAPYELPESEADVIDLLNRLPDGFAKQFQFGLGLLWENRLICEMIAEIPGVKFLHIHGESGSDDAQVYPPFYTLGIRRFHELRKELARIAARHQRAARADKQLLAYQRLLHAADQTKFPRKTRKLHGDAIAELTNIGGERAKLSKRDQKAIVRLVEENAAEIAKTEPQALLRLKADIELVTLKELIASFESQLEKNLTETHWQTFFLGNPFILSLVFSVPAMLVQDNPYMGGKRLDRRGGKISDFLVANASTGNLAIIEIKKPGTELLTRQAYRDDVHSLSPELSGTIVQVLDQRFKLHKTLPVLKDDSGIYDIHAYAVRCIVIAGMTPVGNHEKKSLELARNAFSNVELVTFNEMLGRLKEICQVLSEDPAPPPSPDIDDVPF
jgi:hypothetical protein